MLGIQQPAKMFKHKQNIYLMQRRKEKRKNMLHGTVEPQCRGSLFERKK
jgi:hypothetical protein